jgi:hypothetical protein
MPTRESADWQDVVLRAQAADGEPTVFRAPARTAPVSRQSRPARVCQGSTAASRTEAGRVPAYAGEAYGWGTRGL